MLKNLVKKSIALTDRSNNTGGTATERAAGGDSTNRSKLKGVSNLAINEELQKQPLIDEEEERMRETKFLNDHVEYLRVARKPL